MLYASNLVASFARFIETGRKDRLSWLHLFMEYYRVGEVTPCSGTTTFALEPHPPSAFGFFTHTLGRPLDALSIPPPPTPTPQQIVQCARMTTRQRFCTRAASAQAQTGWLLQQLHLHLLPWSWLRLLSICCQHPKILHSSAHVGL